MKSSLIDDERLMLKVSTMYYLQDQTQSAIAKALKISRPTVAKLLRRAKEIGIVKISITDTSGRKHFDLEQRLEDVFGLKEVFVVDTKSTTSQTQEEIGRAGAELLDRYIRDKSIVGVSLGYTLNSILPHITTRFYPNSVFIPLVGGLGKIPQEVQGNTLAQRLAEKYSGTSIPFYTPARVTNEVLFRELSKEDSIREVFELAQHMNVAVIGIGGVNKDSTLQQTGYLDKDTHNSLLRDGICGAICMQFYDIYGESKRFQINKEILTIDIDTLKKVEYAIGIGFGEEKVDAIRGAIRGSYINILVTDVNTAQALLKKAEEA